MKLLPSFALSLSLFACGDDTAATVSVTPAQVVGNHAEVIFANYSDALRLAQTLKARVDDFVAEPSAARLDAAKRAWLLAREPYGQSEVYRFVDGPIDREDGPEGQLNAWPLDEAYLDYVEGAATAGIVNQTELPITKASLLALNNGGMGDITGIGAAFDEEKAISTGYHALEFLLWGQDKAADGPGTRPWQDYATDAGATASNGQRRGQALQLIASILVEDLEGLVSEWSPTGAYRATWKGLATDDALRRMLSGMAILAKGELASERMDVALQTLDQEDEHSCFSDNTHRDIYLNARGIANVWRGRYEWVDGPGLDDLVRQADPAAAAAMDDALARATEAISAIPVPFDQAIRVNGAPGWMAVDTAVKALYDQADATVAAGLAIDLPNISVELPE